MQSRTKCAEIPGGVMSPRTTKNLTVDFRSEQTPDWVRDVIEAHLAIEAEDAKSAGTIGFMARALVIATMPYRDQKNEDGTPKESFTRQNGDFCLRILAGYPGGIPFGIYPRLLMSWVTSEAVRKQSPVIELGDSLRIFLRDVIDVRSNSGGKRGTATRVSEQIKRLFGALVTAQYTGGLNKRGFTLKNVMIADDLSLNEDDVDGLASSDEHAETGELWTPQSPSDVGQWRSQVRLSKRFFSECVTNPVPIDLRAYKALRDSPLAMDLYTWLTYRMSYTRGRTRPIRWEPLMMQFGSGFNTTDLGQAVREFTNKSFLPPLKRVLVVYPQANLEVTDTGLVLLPSRPHVLPNLPQRELF